MTEATSPYLNLRIRTEFEVRCIRIRKAWPQMLDYQVRAFALLKKRPHYMLMSNPSRPNFVDLAWAGAKPFMVRKDAT